MIIRTGRELLVFDNNTGRLKMASIFGNGLIGKVVNSSYTQILTICLLFILNRKVRNIAEVVKPANKPIQTP